MIRSTILAMLAADALRAVPNEVVIKPRTGYRSPPPHRSSSGTPVKPYTLSGPAMAEGSKAAARRRKQIERGQLKADNGLVRG